MLRYQILLLFPLLLCTCGRGQDTPPPSEAEAVSAVTRQEKVFTEAYAHLDAAVLERMLSDDFSMVYPAKTSELSRDQFLSELAQMKQIFPQMQVTVDSLRMEVDGEKVFASGKRSFTWDVGGMPGGFNENFTNEWRLQGKSWLLYVTEIAQSTQ